MNYSFTIYPDKKLSFSTNKFYSGMHWTKRKKIADQWHNMVQLNTSNRSGMFLNPVHITMMFNNRFDIDNCAGMAKVIIDGMKGTVIKDDDKRFVRKLTLSVWDEDGIRVIVED